MPAIDYKNIALLQKYIDGDNEDESTAETEAKPSDSDDKDKENLESDSKPVTRHTGFV